MNCISKKKKKKKKKTKQKNNKKKNNSKTWTVKAAAYVDMNNLSTLLLSLTLQTGHGQFMHKVAVICCLQICLHGQFTQNAALLLFILFIFFFFATYMWDI